MRISAEKRIASRYAAVLAEAQEGHRIAERAGAVPMNFGDADDPDAMARRCLDIAARYDAVAGHYRAAAAEAQKARRKGEPRQQPATNESRRGWI